MCGRSVLAVCSRQYDNSAGEDRRIDRIPGMPIGPFSPLGAREGRCSVKKSLPSLYGRYFHLVSPVVVRRGDRAANLSDSDAMRRPPLAHEFDSRSSRDALFLTARRMSVARLFVRVSAGLFSLRLPASAETRADYLLSSFAAAGTRALPRVIIN